MDERELFPLAQWFDLSKPIGKAQVEDCLEQMAVYAVKQGDAPRGKEWKRERAALRAAVRAHNQLFS